MRKAKYLAVVLAALMMIALVAGCNKEEATTTTTQAAPSTTLGTVASASATTSGNTQTTRNDAIDNTGRLYGGTLVVRANSDPGSFNPLMQADDYASAMNQNIYNKIVTLDNDYEICPDLAKSWEISEDGLTYTFKFYENVTWHDGVPFTANDVKWSLDAVIKYEGWLAPYLSAIDNIECPDDYTMVIHMAQLDAPMLGFLAWYGNQIVAQHVYDEGENTDWFSNPANQNPIGTGPFKFVEWTTGVSVELEANENYFHGRPYVDRLIFVIVPDASTAWQSFVNGEIDITSIPSAEIANAMKNPDYNVRQFASPSCYYMAFNFQQEIFHDVDLRTAIAKCVDRDALVTRAFSGVAYPGYTYYTPAIAWACNLEARAPEYDMEGAEELLAKYPKDANGVRFNFDIDCFQSQQVADMVAIMKEDLAKVGINVTHVASEILAWEEKVMRARDFDMAITNGSNLPDPHNLQYRYHSTSTSSITGGMYFEEVDYGIDHGRTVANVEERAKVYFEMQQFMADNVVSIPLIDPVSTQVWRKNLDGHPQSEEAREFGVTFNSYWLTRFNDPSYIG